MSDRFQHLYAARAGAALPSAIREICKLANNPGMRSLAGGWPDPEVFPIEELQDLIPDILARKGHAALQYGATEGLIPLREAIAARLARLEGFPVNPEHLIILHGSQQGMDLCCRVFVEPGDMVAVGLPSYFGGFGAVRAAGGDCVGIPVDQDGMQVEALDGLAAECARRGQRLKGVYVIPTFQNPTGVTLSLERRRRLVELADRHDFLIFEDDPYGELRFEGDPVPLIASLDPHNRVIHMRSMSKTFAPGLRLAWLHAEPGALRRLVIAKQFVDACTNTLGQHMMLEFINRGGLDARIAKSVSHYRQKRERLLAALDTHLPVVHTRPKGGFFIWVTLPEGLDAEALLVETAARGVVYVAGRPFFVDDSGANTLRLSYSQVATADIEPAVQILADVVKGATSART